MHAHLDSKIVRRIDWDSLQITNKSYVDEQLKQLHSDAVESSPATKEKAWLQALASRFYLPALHQ